VQPVATVGLVLTAVSLEPVDARDHRPIDEVIVVASSPGRFRIRDLARGAPRTAGPR
jgi:hypothetical protein